MIFIKITSNNILIIIFYLKREEGEHPAEHPAEGIRGRPEGRIRIHRDPAARQGDLLPLLQYRGQGRQAGGERR